MDDEAALVVVSTLLPGVVEDQDAISCWLDDLRSQLEHLELQREEPVDDNEISIKKHISTLPHLFLWSIASLLACERSDLMIFNEVAMSPQANDFLCFLAAQHFDQCGEAFHSILCAYDDELDANSSKLFAEDDQQIVEATREATIEWFQRICEPDMAVTLENGCYLYAAMIASVDSIADQLALQRWRSCYAVQVRKIAQWLRSCAGFENSIMGFCREDDRLALLVPFTQRQALFASSRAELQAKVNARIETDKRVFQRDNDHSSIKSDFKCPKCGSFNTEKFMRQLRSADEPMTTFWRCYKCNKSGREN